MKGNMRNFVTYLQTLRAIYSDSPLKQIPGGLPNLIIIINLFSCFLLVLLFIKKYSFNHQCLSCMYMYVKMYAYIILLFNWQRGGDTSTHSCIFNEPYS